MMDTLPATNDPMHVVIQVPDHESLVDLLEMVSNTNVQARTETITPATPTGESSVTVDLDVLTDKQLEALELALQFGYYERPRDATLTDLADKLQISKSAVSQRLRAAETKLVESALTRFR